MCDANENGRDWNKGTGRAEHTYLCSVDGSLLQGDQDLRPTEFFRETEILSL